LLFYIFPRVSPGYAAAIASACFLIFGLFVLRPIVRSVARTADSEEVVIVGSEVTARKLYNGIAEQDTGENVRISQYADLSRLVEQGSISRVVVADSEIRQGSDAAQALIPLKLRGIRIESPAESFERISRKIWIEGLSAERLIFANGFCPSRLYLSVKRFLDISFSLGLLVLTWPIMVVIAISIRLSSPGKAIFSQERVGFLGQAFVV